MSFSKHGIWIACLFFFHVHSFAQNRIWEPWQRIRFGDSNHPLGRASIEYRMEFDKCEGLHWPGYQIRHDLQYKALVHLRVEGYTCDGELQSETFTTDCNPGQVKYTPASDWHAFRSRKRVLQLTVFYERSPSKFRSTNNVDRHEVRFDFVNGTSEEWVNGRRLEEALAALVQMEKKEKFDSEFELGEQAKSEGRLDDAMEHYRKAQGHMPENARVEGSIADVERMQEKKRVDVAYGAAIREAEELENSGRLQEASEKYKEANALKGDDQRSMEKARELSDRNDRFFDEKELGDRALAEGRLDDATEHYENARKINPANPQIQASIAKVEEAKRLGRVEKRYEEKLESYQEQERSQQERVQQIATGIVLLSVFMFQDMSDDTYGDSYEDEGRNDYFNFGYGFHSYPIRQDTESEVYDGNFSYVENIREDGTLNPFTLQLACGTRFLRRRNMSMALNLQGFVGYGLKKEFALGGELGGEFNVGARNLQLVAKLDLGGVTGFYDGWEHEPSYGFTTTSYATSNGGMDLLYIKMSGGFKAFFSGWGTRQYLEFTADHYKPIGSMGAGLSNGLGLGLTWRASNRMSIQLNVAQFPRMNNTYTFSHLVSFDADNTSSDGTLFQVRVLRCFDYFD